MSKPVQRVLICEDPLEVAAAPGADLSCEDGAVLTFLGVVRGSEAGVPIAGIRYTCYPAMAERKMEEVLELGLQKFGQHRAELVHRVGLVRSGEASLLLVVGSAHSASSYEMSSWYLGEIKARVPIWKEPVSLDEFAGAEEGSNSMV